MEPAIIPHILVLSADNYTASHQLSCEVSTNNTDEIEWTWRRGNVVIGNSTGHRTQFTVPTANTTQAEGNYSCSASVTRGNSEARGEIILSLKGVL